MIPSDLVELHVEAVFARLRSDVELAADVFDGDVTGDPERHVNVWHDTGFYEAHDYTDTPGPVEVTFTLHSVGRSRWAAVWASDRSRSLLLGWVPSIDGRRCWRIASAGTQPVRKDPDVDPVKFIAIDRYTLRSIPR